VKDRNAGNTLITDDANDDWK